MTYRINWQRALCSWLWCGLAAGMLSGPALADVNPFLRMGTALVEDDDERNFEMSARHSQTRAKRSLEAKIEYNFSPTLEVELQMGWAKERGESGRERELELEMRHVLIDHNRGDWGLALQLSLAWEKSAPRSWAYEGPAALAAFVWPLADQRANLHANLGVSRKNSSDNTRALWGLGADWKVARPLVLFGELGGRATEDRLVHGGARWWLRRDKIAFDASLSRTHKQASGELVRGVHVGLSFYDLSP